MIAIAVAAKERERERIRRGPLSPLINAARVRGAPELDGA